VSDRANAIIQRVVEIMCLAAGQLPLAGQFIAAAIVGAFEIQLAAELIGKGISGWIAVRLCG
jgi:hypothetical protein